MNGTQAWWWGAIAIAASTIACGAADDEGEPDASEASHAGDPTGATGPEGPGDPASTPEPTTGSDGRLVLDPPEEGFQIVSAIKPIEAGGDQEWCEIVEIPGAPGEPVFIRRVDIALAPNSHHMNLLAIPPGSSADAAATVGDSNPCVNNGTDLYGSDIYNVGGAAGPMTVNAFPDRVGIRLVGGQKLVANIHYVNTSPEEVPGQAVANFYTATEDEVQFEAQRFGMYMMDIPIPARGQASHSMRCTVSQDIYVFSLSRHTHAMGTDFNVWRSGGAADGEHVFESIEWNENLQFDFEEPVLVKAGEGFQFTCDFDNPTDQLVNWGDLGSDEMCILYGRWYVADPNEAPLKQHCTSFDSFAPKDADGVTVGLPCPMCP